MRVLIADDDPEVRSALYRGFSDGGNECHAFCAPCGPAALLQFGLVRPDVVVMGIQSGDSRCWDTLRRIRELSSVPIIALSSLDEPEIRIKSLLLGADYSVNKPASVRELSARARALVRRDRKSDRLDMQAQQAAV